MMGDGDDDDDDDDKVHASVIPCNLLMKTFIDPKLTVE